MPRERRRFAERVMSKLSREADASTGRQGRRRVQGEHHDPQQLHAGQLQPFQELSQHFSNYNLL